MSPRTVVSILDQYIVGQQSAKKALAVSLRNRWRRKQLTDPGLQADVMPKNILMIGPTGVGKTEIARRMAKLTDAPFVKVEATKYTEVGFKGKDVESIIEDLFSVAKTRARRRLEKGHQDEAGRIALEGAHTAFIRSSPANSGTTFEAFKQKVESGELNDETIMIEVTVAANDRKGSPQGEAALLFGGEPKRKQKQAVKRTLKEAIPLLKTEALLKLVDDSQVMNLAKTLAEEEGIVFIDEIDKIVSEQGSHNADVSSLGVQQDLLPLVEGSTVTLKDGTTICTDTILFICSGAFHVCKPSDMIAELQGRLPVRVTLESLTETDFRRILTEPKFNLLLQQKALMATEKIELTFPEETISEIAKVTAKVNSSAQNIGARRLHTVIERIMDEYSFNCDQYAGKPVIVTPEVVKETTKSLLANINLAKYLL